MLEQRCIFHESRTPQALSKQWHLIKELNLLAEKDQDADDDHIDSLNISFNELEDTLDDKVIMENVELNSQIEDKSANNKKKEEIPLIKLN